MCIIPLTKGKFALIDKEDFDRVSQFKWHFNFKTSKLGYAQRSQHQYIDKGKYTSKIIYLHRFILNIDNDTIIDHINGDTLDNRKQNLRIVSQQINMRNRSKNTGTYTSKYIGVHLHKLTGKWRAQLKLKDKNLSLGLFDSQLEAYNARIDYINKNNLEGYRR